jgi:integrase
VASAVFNKQSSKWVAVFRAPNQPPNKYTRRSLEEKTRAKANAVAVEIDRACRIVEDPESDRLSSLEKAQQLLIQYNVSFDRKANPTTLHGCWRRHPSTIRQVGRDIESFMRYERYIKEFQQFADTTDPEDITVDIVIRYVTALQAEGLSWDGRRHKMLPVKQALAMANRPIIVGMKIDRQERRKPLQSFLPVHLIKIAKALEHYPRERAAFGLMAFCGLRPSEAMAVRLESFDGDLLQVGTKNDWSVRLLPIPATVMGWVRAVDAEDHIVSSSHRGRRGEPLDRAWLNKLITGKLPADVPQLSIKYYRKSFLRLCRRELGLSGALAEQFMGHDLKEISAVSREHYDALDQAEDLRPIAEKIEEWLKTSLQK